MPKALEIRSITEWFEKAVPEPADKNIQTQIGVHFEEVAEMLDTFTSRDHLTDVALKTARQALRGLSAIIKHKGELNILLSQRENMLDSICDQIVTGVGVAHMLHMDVEGALEEVNASNWSKFVDGKPVFDENLKIQKGPAYFKPALATFLN